MPSDLLAPGMLVSGGGWLDRIEAVEDGQIRLASGWSDPARVPWTPVLSDRATYLLCLDVLERRGARIAGELDSYEPAEMRSAEAWDNDARRALMIEAVGRALGVVS